MHLWEVIVSVASVHRKCLVVSLTYGGEKLKVCTYCV